VPGHIVYGLLTKRDPPTDIAQALFQTIDAWRENVADLTPQEILKALDDVRQTVTDLRDRHIR
jgi:hypothetical protein